MLECCLASHGRGLSEFEGERLARTCSGDACDGSLYLSDEAAICAGQAHGLGVGIAECAAMIGPRDSTGTLFSWTTYNVTERGCQNSEWGFGSGDTVTVDAVTGNFLSDGSYAD